MLDAGGIMRIFAPLMTVGSAHTAPWFRRFLAAVGVALLLLLTVSTASPALHHWLHGDAAADASDNCAVVLFAGGVTLALGALAVAAPRIVWNDRCVRSVEEIFLASPRYLRQPERGPPGC
jgi:hypothetical protein